MHAFANRYDVPRQSSMGFTSSGMAEWYCHVSINKYVDYYFLLVSPSDGMRDRHEKKVRIYIFAFGFLPCILIRP